MPFAFHEPRHRRPSVAGRAYLVGGDGLDPWKNPYMFLPRPAQLPKIVSYGADGKEGGTGDDADLVHDPDA